MPYNWLGSRDSNPNTVVQSHVSCHWTTPQHGWDANCKPTRLGVNLNAMRLLDSRCRAGRPGANEGGR